MDITPIHRRVIGLDVHQNKITACALIEQADSGVAVEQREFGGFKRHRRALAAWVHGFAPDLVVMESTGIYWKSPYAALENVGIAAWVVNARHVKNVPGRKTDISDAQWLATLARAGLVRASFVPPAEIRHLRLIARQRQKLGGMLASEKNRLHKVLADAGIRLNVLVSDLHGQSARAMVKALLADEPIHAILERAGRLRASREDLFEALQPEELSAKHRFVLNEIMAHIEYLEATMARFEQQLLVGLALWEPQMSLLETVPGIDRLGAAMLLVEIGTDMDSFGSAARLASWVGICPGNNESAGKRKSGRTRQGNAWVRRLLCEFAQAASRTRCALKDKFCALSIRKGRILAHTDRAHIGEYLLDLPAEPRHTVISRNSILLDIGTPVHLADSLLGWARVGIGPGRTQAERAAIARSGLGYALAAIALGSVIAWILARGITARLERIRTLAQDIRAGRRDQRAPDLGGDEIGDLGRGINAMLDDLNAHEAELADARDALALALADLQETQQAMLHNERLATIGTMAAGIAHELNNPLMGVLNYVAFAQSRASDPKSAEVLAKASRGLGHIRQVVMGLLDFARASPQVSGPVDLVALVGQALDLVGAELAKRDIAVFEFLPVDLPLAWGDPDGLRQVLVNLFINARDALEGCDPKRLDIRAQAGVRTGAQCSPLGGNCGSPATGDPG